MPVPGKVRQTSQLVTLFVVRLRPAVRRPESSLRVKRREVERRDSRVGQLCTGLLQLELLAVHRLFRLEKTPLASTRCLAIPAGADECRPQTSPLVVASAALDDHWHPGGHNVVLYDKALRAVVQIDAPRRPELVLVVICHTSLGLRAAPPGRLCCAPCSCAREKNSAEDLMCRSHRRRRQRSACDRG